jgi:predicted RNase H-like HicB family nuclease
MKIRAVCEYDAETRAWSVICPELPGLTSCGDTEMQALEHFKQAIDLFFTPADDSLPVESKVVEMVV